MIRESVRESEAIGETVVTLSARASLPDDGVSDSTPQQQSGPCFSGFMGKLPARCWADRWASMAIADDVACVKLPLRRAQILREQK